MEQKDETGMIKLPAAKINAQLAIYRDRGTVDHTKTLAIPPEQRIPELIKLEGGRDRVSAVLAAALLSAFNHIEKAKMSADQIIELAEGIIDSSHEDQLSIEDVLLFLKDLLLGKMGKISEKIDMPLFFELFEKYRDRRYKTLENFKYERHLQLKNMGQSSRGSNEVSLNRDEDPQEVLNLMQTFYEEKNNHE